MGVGRARGKLLFIGEHAAVYGHPTVGLSLPWGVEVSDGPGGFWDLPGLGPHEAGVRALVDRFAALAAEEDLPAPAPRRLDFTTDLALSSGLGSSGALCAALVNLFWPGLDLASRDRLAWKGEALFHGTPSGIDTCLALREGWWLFEGPSKPPRATALPTPDLALVLGAVRRVSDTKTLVGGLARRRAEGDPLVKRSLDELGALASSVAAALVAGRLADLPAVVNGARGHLAALDLEPPHLTRVLDRALRLPGAQAAKLSGAGGGGAFFALFRDRTSAQAALEPLVQAAPAADWTCPPRLI